MYEFFLFLHNLIRWAALILAIVAAVKGWLGWLRKQDWTPADRRWGVFLGISLDIQFLLGLILYFFFSPITQAAIRDFGSAMSQRDLRFFAVEHVLIMVLSVVFAHVGSVMVKRAKDPVGKHRMAAIWFTLTLLLIIAGMPWDRPLFRLP